MSGDDAITIIAGVSPTPPDGMHLPVGTKFGRYVIQQVLGEGGMGVVYEAFDPSLNRKLAIKVLRIDKTVGTEMDTRSAKDRLLREAQAMAQVGHPNLVAVYDVGTFGASVFIAMEMVNGLTLRDWRPHVKKDDWRAILDAYIQAGQGLSAAHLQSLIHRDFKPENVMIGHEDSRVRVMDFGLVRSVTAGDDPSARESSNVLAKPLTQTGTIMGTPAYMAPEQFLGDTTDHTTDQFAFCVALYEALYGHRPFAGKNAAGLARNVLQGKITLPPRKCPVPGYILTAVLKGLQTDPADRHDSMDVLLDALREPERLPGRPWLLYLSTLAVAVLGYTLYVTTNHPDAEVVETIPAPPPEGTVPFGTARGLIEDNKADVDRCALVARTLDVRATRVTLRVRLTASGKVDWVRGDGADEILLVCFRRFAEKWKWPVPEDGATTVEVRIPLVETLSPVVPDPAKAAPPKKPRSRRSSR